MSQADPFDDLDRHAAQVYAELQPLITDWTDRYRRRDINLLTRIEHNRAALDPRRLHESRWDLVVEMRDGAQVRQMDVFSPVDFGSKVSATDIRSELESFLDGVWGETIGLGPSLNEEF